MRSPQDSPDDVPLAEEEPLETVKNAWQQLCDAGPTENNNQENYSTYKAQFRNALEKHEVKT